MANKPKVDRKGQMELKFDLVDLKINRKDQIISCRLKLPSKVPAQYDGKEQGQNPTVFLDIYCNNEDGKRCCKVMKEVIHPTILNAKAIQKGKCGSQLLLWVEPYTGNLLDYLERMLRKGPSLPKSKRTLLPTPIIRIILSQVIDGMNYLRMQDSYHGNFTFKETYYKELKLEIFVKLRNFKNRSGERSICQSEDLKALGTELTLVSSIADQLNKQNMAGHIFDCSLLDDLANIMKLVTPTNLNMTYKKIKKHPLFWNINERKRFFVYQVPKKMESKGFRKKVEKCAALCVLPWNSDDHNGFLQLMNQFRLKRNDPAYRGFSRCHFVNFICGLYTHEHEPTLYNNGKKVDETVIAIHAKLCLTLSNLIQCDNEEWL